MYTRRDILATLADGAGIGRCGQHAVPARGRQSLLGRDRRVDSRFTLHSQRGARGATLAARCARAYRYPAARRHRRGDHRLLRSTRTGGSRQRSGDQGRAEAPLRGAFAATTRRGVAARAGEAASPCRGRQAATARVSPCRLAHGTILIVHACLLFSLVGRTALLQTF